MSINRTRILIIVDVAGALAADTPDDAVWLVDNNKTGGSTDEGTRQLKTAVRRGDVLIWTAMSLECEAFVAVEAIEIDPAYCEITHGVYEGTDIRFWLGKIKKDPGTSVIPYDVRFRLGSRVDTMSLSGANLPSITGGESH